MNKQTCVKYTFKQKLEQFFPSLGFFPSLHIQSRNLPGMSAGLEGPGGRPRGWRGPGGRMPGGRAPGRTPGGRESGGGKRPRAPGGGGGLLYMGAPGSGNI